MESFCTRSGISQEFSAPITLQQNGVVEKKNKVIQEMARAMLHNMDVARNLWGEAINTVCHMVNRMYFRPGTRKTPYKLWKGRKPNVKYFKIFGSTCFILKDREMWENLRAVKRYTTCISIEQTLFKQIMIGDKVLNLVHLFLGEVAVYLHRRVL